MSTGPGGGQVTCLLDALAKLKKKGVTGNHVVFSFVSRRVQPLQHRKHPAFRYEGTKDPTRFSSDPMAHSEVIKRCYKVLNNFDESLTLPALFWAGNPSDNFAYALDHMLFTMCQTFQKNLKHISGL